MEQFYNDFGVSFVGIPSTIDNDIYGTEYCLGVDTALNVCREAIDSVRDTASSFPPGVCHRDHGARLRATWPSSPRSPRVRRSASFPSWTTTSTLLGARLKPRSKGRTYVLAIVAEGTRASTKIVNWLKHDVQMDTRITILGHIQRGGSPTVHDRLMAFEFATMAVNKLLQDKEAHYIVVYNKGQFDFVTIDYVNSGKVQLNPDHLKLAYKMVT